MKKLRIIGWAYFLILIGFVSVRAESGIEISSVRKSFEWGMYDSLIVRLESFFENSPVSDSATLADCHLYLGVAYFGRGRLNDARTEFSKALNLSPQIMLDAYYVTKEIHDLFLDTKRELERAQQRALQTDSLLNVKELQIKKSELLIRDIDLSRKRVSNYYLSGIFYALSGLSALGSTAAYLTAEKENQEFVLAAQKGDLREYLRLKKQVERFDQLHVIGLGITGVFLIPGTYFLGKAVFQPAQKVAVVPGWIFGRHGNQYTLSLTVFGF